MLIFDSNKISGAQLLAKGRDGKFIPDSDAPSGFDLWIRDASGAERLAHPSVFTAKFSPDGQRIAFATSECVLRVEDLQGNKLAEVEGAYMPQWKPDGNVIVFSKVPEGRHVYHPETFHLATLDPVSGQVNLLTDGRFDDGRPEYHPSGDWILFVSGGRNGFASFWKLDPRSGEPVQVTNIGQRAVDETFVPTPYRKTIWSPDGRWFLYDFKSGEREQIWGLHFAANGNLLNATRIADGLDPAWTEEGRAFVYARRGHGRVESATATLP
jgi:Tol biopolymer transport system component